MSGTPGVAGKPDRVVPALDVAEAGHFRLGLGRKPATPQQLGFQGREEALGHGIIVGSPTDLMDGRTPASDQRLPNDRGVLATWSAVMDHILRATLANCCFQRVRHHRETQEPIADCA